MSRYEPVVVYDRRSGKKLGLRPRTWLRLYPHLSETPAARARRAPKKQAAPATESDSAAVDTAPEEEK